MPETCWTGCSLLFLMCISFQQLDAMSGIVLTDLMSTEPIADCRPCFRLTRRIIALAAHNWLFCSTVHDWGTPVASDPALTSRLALLPVLPRRIRPLTDLWSW